MTNFFAANLAYAATGRTWNGKLRAHVQVIGLFQLGCLSVAELAYGLVFEAVLGQVLLFVSFLIALTAAANAVHQAVLALFQM